MQKTAFLNKVEKTIQKYSLLEKGERVVIAVSGGPDSQALIYSLAALKDKYNLSLLLAHINYGLRGKESDRDEKFVMAEAKKLKLPLEIKRINPKIWPKNRTGVQEKARQIRYDFLLQILKKYKADKIAVAHHQDDQAETVLMRLLRGSGSTGLSGIPIQRDKIIRPLLEISQKEILKFLKQNKASFRIDSSNLKKAYLRNKIRLELLPYLEKYNPRIKEILVKTADILREEEKFLEKKSQEIFSKVCKKRTEVRLSFDLKKFGKLEPFWQRRLVRLAWEKIAPDKTPLEYDQIERVLNLVNSKKSGRKVNLKSTFVAGISAYDVLFYKKEKERNSVYRIHLPGEFKSNGFKLESRILERTKMPEKINNPNEKVAFLDWEKLKPPFYLRHFKTGDRFIPLGLRGTKKLSDFFVDLKIPTWEKEKILLLISKNKICWIAGYRISEEFKITEKTQQVLKLQLSCVE